jgi:hypothetical protein
MLCFYVFQGGPIFNDIFSIFFPALPVQFHAIFSVHKAGDLSLCVWPADF